MLTDDMKITTVAPTATGTSTITSSAIDMTGFDECTVIVRLGSPATNNNIKLQQSATSGGSYADLTGTLRGNHATNNPLIINIARPRLGFLKYVVTRGTTTTIDSVTIIQGGSKGVRPVTQPSGTASGTHYAPAEGTA